MKEKVVIFRETQCSHTLCIWFLSPPLYSNILARGDSLFRKSAGMRKCGVSGALRISTKWRTSATREVPQAAHYLGAAEMKSHNAVTAFPVILAHNHVREQGFPALRYSICARLRLYGKVR